MTNVNTGDLALCVGDENPLRGKTCTVGAKVGMQHTKFGSLLVWSVEFSKPVTWLYRAEDDKTFQADPHLSTIGQMPDMWLRKIGGPGLVDETEILRERARDLVAGPSNLIFPDIRELDRAAGRVDLHKVTPYAWRDVTGTLWAVEPVKYWGVTPISIDPSTRSNRGPL